MRISDWSSDVCSSDLQVAQIVNQEFPTYDADTSGDLNQTEFATWMTRLRTATDPTVDPQSEQVKSWIGQAFAAADADKSGAVSKEELTGFLSRGACAPRRGGAAVGRAPAAASAS